MPNVEVVCESPQPAGWLFDVQWIDHAGQLHKAAISLSWADYNHWSVSGADEPADVAQAVIRFWITRPDSPQIPDRFDASVLRRHFADADVAIPRLLG